MSMTAGLEIRSPKPYGNVTYADPKNGKYPIDTEAHIRAAWSYINMPKNAAVYPLNGVTLESVKSRIRAAMKRIGAQVDDDGSSSAQRDPGWEQRRKRWANSLTGRAERRGMQVEMRSKPDGAGGTDFVFEGYASVFDAPFPMFDKWGDPYTEVVRPGAFSRSLARPDLDVPFLIGHDDKRLALARTRNGTMHLFQDSRGLHVTATMDGRRSDVRDLAYAVERGDTDEMSVGFITRGQQWSDDYETRSMLDLDIHRGDVSSVPLAAIPETAGALMTALPVESLSRRAAEARAVVNSAADWDHGPVTGTHSHGHPADGEDGTLHIHEHDHADDADHDHMHPQVGPNSRSAGHRHEHRGNPVDQDMGDAPDYNAADQARGMQCTNDACAHTADVQPPAAKFCSYCGDALVRIDDQGVPGMEEEAGAQAALALRRRQLELLVLAAR